MNAELQVARDERTVAVENASYKWAYTLLTYALLFDVMYRGFFRYEAAWDLMVFVIGSGIVCTIYQSRQKVLPQGWSAWGTLIGLGASVIAALAAVLIAGS